MLKKFFSSACPWCIACFQSGDRFVETRRWHCLLRQTWETSFHVWLTHLTVSSWRCPTSRSTPGEPELHSFFDTATSVLWFLEFLSFGQGTCYLKPWPQAWVYAHLVLEIAMLSCQVYFPPRKAIPLSLKLTIHCTQGFLTPSPSCALVRVCNAVGLHVTIMRIFGQSIFRSRWKNYWSLYNTHTRTHARTHTHTHTHTHIAIVPPPPPHGQGSTLEMSQERLELQTCNFLTI